MSCSPVLGPHCSGCPAALTGQRLISYDGSGANRVLLVDGGPGTDEVGTGKPFAGSSGRLLGKFLRQLGLNREDFLLASATFCKPPYPTYLETNAGGEALNHCRPYLDDLLTRYNPAVTVTFGDVAMRRMLGLSNLLANQAYVHDSVYGPVIPTFHFQDLIEGKLKFTPAVRFAIQKAVRIARNGRVEPELKYVLDSDIDTARAYFANWNPADPLAVDIETPYSSKLDKADEEEEDKSYTIIRIGFSHTPNTAISFPWTEPFISLAKEVLAKALLPIFWNKNYDCPRLIASGCTFGGDPLDAMYLWHWIQSDLPKKLVFVAPYYTNLPPWKDLASTQPAFYNAVDNDACLQIYLGAKKDAEAENRWEPFVRHYIAVSPILTEMSRAGVLVDKEAQGELKKSLMDALVDHYLKLQELVPEQYKKIKEYKKAPGVSKKVNFKSFNEELSYKYAITRQREDGTWIKVWPFNFDSSPQVLAFMRALAPSLKLKMPKSRKDGKETADKKALAKFAKKNPAFKEIEQCRSRADLIGTFIWETGNDNRLHTSYGFNPSTWRKSSKNPNMQNIPKRGPLAKGIRKTIVAAPGHVFIEADSSSIEAVLVGYWANDPDYIRAAKSDIHAFITSHWMGKGVDINLPDAELIGVLKGIKKAHKEDREKAKRGGHSTNYLATPYGLCDENPDVFFNLVCPNCVNVLNRKCPLCKGKGIIKSGEAQAREFQEFYFGLFPKIRKWHKDTLHRVRKEGALLNHFGYKHYFYDVLRFEGGTTDPFDGSVEKFTIGDREYEGAWQYEKCKDAKRAIAFGPQSDASAIQTEFLLALANSEYAILPRTEDPDVLKWLRLIIHDAIVMEVPETQVEYAAKTLYGTMTSGIPQLGGLTIGAEVSVGKNLGEMEVIEI